jgi:hypothetical protein
LRSCCWSMERIKNNFNVAAASADKGVLVLHPTHHSEYPID